MTVLEGRRDKKRKARPVLSRCTRACQMLSCCSLGLAALWQQLTRHRPAAAGRPAGMDVSLLREQYHCLRRRQRSETHVVLFKKGIKDTSGESLFSTIPINQEVNPAKPLEEHMAVKGIQFDFVSDSEDYRTPWRTHLGIHRMAHPNRPREATSGKTSDTNAMTATSPREPGSAKRNLLLTKHASLENPVPLEKSENPNDTCPAGSAILSQRKFSAPVILSRQLSLDESRSSQASTKLQYYPFPQKKQPKQSEAARRLGLYESH
ncbi:uncharacterized protein C9orf152 [Amia ocellicauda]|uniref:uncharacterized protein C9orf152 n=1 Tax=Amia ocellicauda TaxID=2972642 RepID=UPI0034647017